MDRFGGRFLITHSNKNGQEIHLEAPATLLKQFLACCMNNYWGAKCREKNIIK